MLINKSKKLGEKQESMCNLDGDEVEDARKMFPSQTEQDHLVQGHFCIPLGKPWAETV